MNEIIPGLARHTDPETSHEAAEEMDASNLIESIYRVMAEYGDEGCISDDVDDDLPGVLHQSLTPRFRQMLDRGMIEYTGEKRRSLKSNRLQLVRRVLSPPFIPPLKRVVNPGRAEKLQQCINQIKSLERHKGASGVTEWIRAADIDRCIEKLDQGSE